MLPSKAPAQSQRAWRSWEEREMHVAAAVRKGFLEEGVDQGFRGLTSAEAGGGIPPSISIH